MVKIRAKRRTLVFGKTLERVFSVPSDKALFLIATFAITVLVSVSLVVLGMKSFKLKEENRWMAERIEQKKIEVQRLKGDISELLSSFQLVKVDGE